MTQLHLFLSHWALPLSTDDRIQLLCLEPLSRLCILSCSMCSQAQQIAFNFKKLPQHYSSQLPKKIPITDVHISPLVTLPLTKLSPRDVPSISPSEMSLGPCCFLAPPSSHPPSVSYHAGHFLSVLSSPRHLRLTQLHGSTKYFPITAILPQILAEFNPPPDAGRVQSSEKTPLLNDTPPDHPVKVTAKQTLQPHLGLHFAKSLPRSTTFPARAS